MSDVETLKLHSARLAVKLADFVNDRNDLLSFTVKARMSWLRVLDYRELTSMEITFFPVSEGETEIDARNRETGIITVGAIVQKRLKDQFSNQEADDASNQLADIRNAIASVGEVDCYTYLRSQIVQIYSPDVLESHGCFESILSFTYRAFNEVGSIDPIA